MESSPASDLSWTDGDDVDDGANGANGASDEGPVVAAASVGIDTGKAARRCTAEGALSASPAPDALAGRAGARASPGKSAAGRTSSAKARASGRPAGGTAAP
ncbi:hypothetical protein FUT87_25505, partial [Mitsuaria sp. TWR114]